jgi:glutamate carboxypeptidase
MNPDALRDRLIRWCNQNSGSHNFAGLDAMRALLAAEFARLPGAAIESLLLAGTPAQALRIRVRPAAPVQLFFSGHYDTVYGPEDPFQRCEQLAPDRLRGPGVIDMKGGLVVMLAALEAFERTAHGGRIGYEVLLNPDEEIGSHGASPFFVEAAARYQLGLIFEPARPNGDLVHSRKGTGNFTVTCHGRAAHAASGPRLGRNAIAALAEFLVAVHRLPDALPGVLLNIGHIRGGGPATNVVPDFAEAKLDVRITHLSDRAAVFTKLDEFAAPIRTREGYGLHIAGGFSRPPMERSATAEAAFAAWQQCAQELKLAPFDWVHAGGASDANNLSAAGLPCLDGLGPIGDRLHSAEEWAHLPSLATRAELATRFLIKFAAGKITLPTRASA